MMLPLKTGTSLAVESLWVQRMAQFEELNAISILMGFLGSLTSLGMSN